LPPELTEKSERQDLSPRRYLLTGASGFIGTALCRFLREQGHSVRALVRRPGKGPWDESLLCDLAVDELPAGLMDGIDGVFHLAGIAHVQDIARAPDSLYWRVNVDATEAILESALQSGVGQFVYFSSVKAVADPGERCVDESWDEPPAEAYGRSKREAERRVLAAGRRGGMHVCNLRPTLVYGPGVKGNLARMLEAARGGRCPPLPEFGNRRSLVGLQDLIQAAWLAANEPAANGCTYIVSDGVDYSTRTLFEVTCRAAARAMPRLTVPVWTLYLGAALGDRLGWLLRRPMPLNSSVLSRISGSACYRGDRIRRELSWRPRHQFADVLPAMLHAAGTAAGE
jgi:nucleoside-diphosphate-sugar epimerase